MINYQFNLHLQNQQHLPFKLLCRQQQFHKQKATSSKARGNAGLVVSEKTQVLMAKVLEAMTVSIPDEVLDAKRSPIDKILQSEQALALHNFRLGEGILAHQFEKQKDNSQAGLHILGAQVIARSGASNKDAMGITNLLFGIQLVGQSRVKTTKYRQLTPPANWKQIMKPIIDQNENQALEQSQETQIIFAINNMSPSNAGPRDQPPPGHVLYAQRNAAIPQSTVFPPALIAEQEIPEIPNVITKDIIKDHMHKWMLKGFDLISVGNNDKDQYWPDFGSGVPHATDWRKAKQQGQTSNLSSLPFSQF
ncbi:MAG: hypothetical protein EZS28_027719 [Streblomastix strix]|uniref:Uncharacterized protein n=1 Tax=Streblomastix strix TaxID=222440 RepID=A0A5J4V2M7_9EUKA|nr:MAG: hypothetical protein EZS28_027719 [Streblomastix strix]